MKIAFYHAWGPDSSYIDKLISIFTLGKFSHTEIVFEDRKCFSIDGRTGVARFKNIDFNPEKWTLYDLDFNPEEEGQIRINALKIQQQKIKYDYWGAFTCGVFPFCIHKKGKLFCSESTVNLINSYTKYNFFGNGCHYSPMKVYRDLQKFTQI